MVDAGPGHNNPSEGEVDIWDMIDRRDDLLGSVALMPKILLEDRDAQKAGDLARMIGALLIKMGEKHDEIKRPHMLAAKAVDDWWREAMTPLEEARATVRDALKAYMVDRLEDSPIRSNAGSVITGTRPWTFRDLDPKTIDLEALRPYLPESVLEKAVRAAIKAGVRPDDTGAQPIAGVCIYQDVNVTVR